MNILFVGPNASEHAQATGHGDVAAARWAYGLLRALADQGHSIVALTHTHERIWPRGEKLWRSRDDRYFNSDWPSVDVQYPAIYKLREKWLDWAYPRKARQILARRKFDAALLYNCMYPYLTAVQHEAARLGVPVFPIVLDGDDPRRDNWAKLKADTRESAGVVFLSYWAAKNYPCAKPVLHLDGGAERWNGSEPDGKCERAVKTFVHTGLLDKWRGLDFMKEVVRILDMRRVPVKIVMCGRILPEMREAFFNRRCVEMRGFVPEDELKRICLAADGFLNVRDPKVGDNILNYPSKMPHCLSYGKPVISTWTDSLSPDYREVLYMDSQNTPESFADKMIEVTKLTDVQKQSHRKLVENWFNANKLWRLQGMRLSDWISDVVNGGRP